MTEELRNQMIYLASVDMLRRMLRDKKFDKRFLIDSIIRTQKQ